MPLEDKKDETDYWYFSMFSLYGNGDWLARNYEFNRYVEKRCERQNAADGEDADGTD